MIKSILSEVVSLLIELALYEVIAAIASVMWVECFIAYLRGPEGTSG